MENSRLEQRSVIKFMLAEKCKPCDIYKWMSNVFQEARSRKKNIFINVLNMRLALQAWIEKTVHEVETHWQSGKEKVPGAAVSKKQVMLTVFRDMKRPMTIDFLEKDVTLNGASYC